MAFDACMLAEVLSEIRENALGAKIEKIHQPEKEQIILLTHTKNGGRKMIIDAGSNNPRIGFTAAQKENPASPPMFCMLLRKHLTGAKLVDVIQPEFERVAFLVFETYDEMGFPCKRLLIAEIMGKKVNFVEDTQRLRPKNSEVFRLWGDNTKIKGLTGFEPQYDIRRGLEETIKWFTCEENLKKYKSNIYNV
jgi:hypothetical protein